MASHEFEELKGMFEQIMGEVGIIKNSLRSCQSHCYVDNPPGKWRGLFRAVRALFKTN